MMSNHRADEVSHQNTNDVCRTHILGRVMAMRNHEIMPFTRRLRKVGNSWPITVKNLSVGNYFPLRLSYKYRSQIGLSPDSGWRFGYCLWLSEVRRPVREDTRLLVCFTQRGQRERWLLKTGSAVPAQAATNRSGV